jgi:hypothetical protein
VSPFPSKGKKTGAFQKKWKIPSRSENRGLSQKSRISEDEVSEPTTLM